MIAVSRATRRFSLVAVVGDKSCLFNALFALAGGAALFLSHSLAIWWMRLLRQFQFPRLIERQLRGGNYTAREVSRVQCKHILLKLANSINCRRCRSQIKHRLRRDAPRNLTCFNNLNGGVCFASGARTQLSLGSAQKDPRVSFQPKMTLARTEFCRIETAFPFFYKFLA